MKKADAPKKVAKAAPIVQARSMRSARGAAAPDAVQKSVNKKESTLDLTVFGSAVAKPKSPVKADLKKRDVKA